MMAKWLKKTNPEKTQKHALIIDFIYQVLFSRDAEQAAIDHWSTYLEQGLSYKELLELLWRSQEFETKAEQNLLFKKPAALHAIPTKTSEFINNEMFETIIETLSQEKNLLLQIDKIRSLVAQWRYRDLRGSDNVKFYEKANGRGIIENTIGHNEAAIRTHVDHQRGDIIISPLASINYVKANLSSLKVLSIGARNEMELFSLLALGFDISNITMVDLISYSPYIELGDMHNLRYKDNNFDIIVISTVFLCSNDKKKAASEVLRVLKPGGIIAFGDKCALASGKDDTPKEAQIKSEYLTDSDEVLGLFQPNVKTIYFKTDPIPPFNDEITTTIGVIFDVH